MKGWKLAALWLFFFPVLVPAYLLLLLACFLVNGWVATRQTLWPDSLG